MERKVHAKLGDLVRWLRLARQQLWRLASLGVLLATFIASPVTVLAMPPDPIDSEPDETPMPPDGFTWSMVPRFGSDSNGDGVTDYTYDPAFVQAATFAVKFKGCPPGPHDPDIHYAWEIDGVPTTITSCGFTRDFTPGSHHIKYTATAPGWPAVVQEEDILVRDILIVSLGDSIAAGEGNPDVPQQLDPWTGLVSAGAKWVDRRCHRSAYAGPAQAALALEQADPHTSVTFVSLACSGAELIHVGYFPYMGIEPGPNDTEPLPPQLDALRPIVGTRPIDALTISGGANDLVFGGIVEDCTTQFDCHTIGWIVGGLEARLQNILPGAYLGLINKIALGGDGQGPEPGLNVANVYFTEYPNPVRDADGDVCDSILGEILFPLSINKAEASWAETALIQPLNATMHQAVDSAAISYPAINWQYVSGIADAFAGPGFGHGYCAGGQSWIRLVHDSACQQGPLLPTTGCAFIPPWELQATRGTMHPTAIGHHVYRDRLKALLEADLFPDQPLPEGPSFEADGASGLTINQVGASGWVTGSCIGTTCASDRAVLTVVASDAASIGGTGVAVDGIAACDATSVPGVICTAAALDPQQYGWQFDIAAEGIHRLEFSASNGNEQVSTFLHEVKVDLTDPAATAAITGAVPNAAGWYNVPVSVTLSGSDVASGLGLGSGVYLVDYILDGVPGQVSAGEAVPVGTDGVHTLAYQAIDLAGRRSVTQTLTVQVDTTPPAIVCAQYDGLWHAADVGIDCTSSDSGSGVANPIFLNFALFTAVPAGTETANAYTPGQTVCDHAGNCSLAGAFGPIKVDKQAPTITLGTPANATYVLNQAVTASYNCTDGGSGVATCAGPVANGSPVDTLSAGSHTFTVDAADNVGNTASQSVSYTVTYGVCVLYDQDKAHRRGSTVPIKLQVCDAAGGNVSAAAIEVNAAGLTKQDSSASGDVEAPGTANPDDNFRFDADLVGYIFNLSTNDLSTGTWLLSFTVAGDPVTHTVRFDVR